MRSAPAAAIAGTSRAVTSSDGSPAVTNGMNALPWENASRIRLLIERYPPVPGDGGDILVAPALKD